MKKKWAALVAVVLVCCCSMTALAASGYYPGSSIPFLSEEDGNTYMGTFQTSKCTEEQKQVIRDCAGNDRVAIFYHTGQKYLYIYILPDDFESWGQIGLNPDKSSISLTLLPGQSTHTVRRVAFNQLGEPVGTHCTDSVISSVLNDMILIGGRYFSNHDLPTGTPNSLILDYAGTLYFRDDDGLFSPEEPDPGPSSSEAPPPSPGVSIPEAQPSTSPYVPYDTTSWNDVYSRVWKAINSSSNLGLLLVGIIILVMVFVRIVKNFFR